jgi:hypothetical protein
MSRYILMDPNDNLNWSNDWTDFLNATTSPVESITARLWTIDPDASPTLLSNTTTAAVRVAGLTKGTVYRLSEKITSSQSNVAERSITIRCEER